MTMTKKRTHCHFRIWRQTRPWLKREFKLWGDVPVKRRDPCTLDSSGDHLRPRPNNSSELRGPDISQKTRRWVTGLPLEEPRPPPAGPPAPGQLQLLRRQKIQRTERGVATALRGAEPRSRGTAVAPALSEQRSEGIKGLGKVVGPPVWKGIPGTAMKTVLLLIGRA